MRGGVLPPLPQGAGQGQIERKKEKQNDGVK